MVYPDLSASQTKPHEYNLSYLPIGSISDRLVALLLDFLIFSPVISLLVAGLVRKTKTLFLINAVSEEALVAIGLMTVVVFALLVLLQTVFLYFWQATPGQYFMQLRVVSYPHPQDRLSLNQCIVRAFFWSTGLGILGIPFLEVASHPLRRSFHERVSDTLVVTLKIVPDDGPMPIESRFLSSWMRMSFLFLLLLGVGGFFQAYEGLLSGKYREVALKAPYSCREMPKSDFVGTQRLDVALALYLLNEITSECLEREAEASLWGDPVNSQAMAYLAKYFTADSFDQEKYFSKVCEGKDSALCAVARYSKEDGGSEELLSTYQSSLWTTQVLLADEKYNRQDYVGSLKIIEQLQSVPELRGGLEKRFVRSAWGLYSSLQATKGTRIPASTAPKADGAWLEKIKERYDLP